MNSLWIRRLIRKHDDLGHAVAGLYLLAYYLLVRRRRAALGAVALLLPVGLLLQPHPLEETVGQRLVDVQASYRITDLGTPSGAQLFIPTAVGGGNQVAGLALMDDDNLKGFYWNNGRMQDLGSLGGAFCIAYGINDGGQVVGVSETRNETLHAFVWQNGQMRDLTGNPDEFTGANGINAGGQIVGWTYNEAANTVHATLWQNAKPKDLGLLPGNTDSYAIAVNGSGDIVGDSTRHYGPSLPFLYHNGRMQALAMPGTSGYATGINDSCMVIGAVEFGEHFQAFLTQNHRSVELGTLGGQDSIATGINVAGQVVGFSTTARGEVHAFLWESGKLIDLNTLIPSGSGWELLTAYSIGKSGQIVGIGLHHDELRAYLLVPFRD